MVASATMNLTLLIAGVTGIGLFALFWSLRTIWVLPVALYGLVIPLEDLLSFSGIPVSFSRVLALAAVLSLAVRWLVDKDSRETPNLFGIIYGAVVWASGLWSVSPGNFTQLVVRFALIMALFLIMSATRLNSNEWTVIKVSVVVGGVVTVLVELATVLIYGLSFSARGTVLLGAERVADPNFLSASLIPATILALSFALNKGSRWRIVWACAAVIMTIGIVMTGSRGGLVGLSAGVLVYFVTLHSVPAKTKLLALLIGGGTIIALSGVLFRISEEALTRISDLDYGGNGRVEIWLAYWQEFLARPLLGAGFGSSTPVDGRDFVGGLAPVVSTHNTLLQVLVETGLLGFVAFVSLLGSLIYRSRRMTESVAGFIGLFAAGMFLHMALFKPLWFTMSLLHKAGEDHA